MTVSISHYLIVYNVRDGKLVEFVDNFGTDVESASAAYANKEREYRELPNGQDFEIVLVGADSRKTLEVTHSRYFRRGEPVPF